MVQFQKGKGSSPRTPSGKARRSRSAQKSTAKKAPAHVSKKAPTRSKKAKARLWLMYPQRLVQRAVIYEIGQKFNVVTNIRQAYVTEDIGVFSLKLQGTRDENTRVIKWLERIGVKVEPVEINVIES